MHIGERLSDTYPSTSTATASSPAQRISRTIDVLSCATCSFATAPNITRLYIHSVYAAPNMSVVAASERVPEICLDRAHDHHELADEPARAGQAGIRHREQHEKRGEYRHACSPPRRSRRSDVNADGRTCTPTHRNNAPEMKPWEIIWITAPSMPSALNMKIPKRDEAHVRDRGIGDQLLHVGLHQRDEADVDDGDQR